MIRFFKMLLTLCFVLLCLWGAGFAWFLTLIPSQASENKERTDAIVVLTGGTLRLERGFELLAEEKAPVLFISGVETGVTLAELMRNKEIKAHMASVSPEAVVLGYQARTTTGNAEEIAEWAREHNIRSIRLVTSNYHMPRGFHELESAMPEVRILPDPVTADRFSPGAWWREQGSLKLLLLEYHKFMAMLIRHMV